MFIGVCKRCGRPGVVRGALLGLLALLLAGCASALPRYEWRDHETAMGDLADRMQQVETVWAACSVRLEDADGPRTSLDGALLARSPSQLRLRTWKFGHPVFDMTLTDGEVWVAQEDAAASADVAVPADAIAGGWSLFEGVYLREAVPGASYSAGPIYQVISDGGNGANGGNTAWIVSTIDRRTLTLRRVERIDAAGRVLATLELDRYRMFDGIVWPTRWTFASTDGRIVLTLSDVALNDDLPASAFTPPRGAVRQP